MISLSTNVRTVDKISCCTSVRPVVCASLAIRVLLRSAVRAVSPAQRPEWARCAHCPTVTMRLPRATRGCGRLQLWDSPWWELDADLKRGVRLNCSSHLQVPGIEVPCLDSVIQVDAAQGGGGDDT